MRGRYHLDQAAGEIEAAIAAAIHHAFELFRDLGRPKMAHLDIDAAVRRDAAGSHFRVNRAADHVAGRAFKLRIVVAHEAVHRAVEQMPTGPAQAFLQHGAGHAGVRPGKKSGRMELHHLHVAQRQAEPKRHGEAVHGLVAGRRVIAIHGRAAAGREQHRLRTDEAKFARAHVDHQHAGERAVWRRDQRDGAMLLKAADRPGPDLLHQPVDDLDAGEVALVHGAVEGLAGEGLAMQRAVGIAVEETADLVFQLAHALDRGRDQRPRQLLMRQPFAALDRVHEMALDRIAGVERDVVAALHHARAAAFAEETLARNGNVEIGIGFERMQCGKQPGATGAEDQNIGFQVLDVHAIA